MDRREFVRALGLAAAGLGGCVDADADAIPHPTPPVTTPTPTPEPERFVEALGSDIVAAADSVSEGPDGTVTVTVPVENTAVSARSATLVVTIEDDGTQYTVDRSITVPGNVTEKYTVTFDLSWEQATDGKQPQLRAIYLYNPEYRTPRS